MGRSGVLAGGIAASVRRGDGVAIRMSPAGTDLDGLTVSPVGERIGDRCGPGGRGVPDEVVAAGATTDRFV